MNNMSNSMVNAYQQYRANPMEAINGTFNVPQDVDTSNPENIIQHLLNSGQITQQQLYRANSLRNNPFIQILLNNR